MRTDTDPYTYAIIGLAIKVHRLLGPGLLEAVYEAALFMELVEAGYAVKRQHPLPVLYRGKLISDSGYFVDLLVDDQLVIELKNVSALLPIHEAQILTYMRLGNFPKGLLMNFNSINLSKATKRFVM